MPAADLGSGSLGPHQDRRRRRRCARHPAGHAEGAERSRLPERRGARRGGAAAPRAGRESRPPICRLCPKTAAARSWRPRSSFPPTWTGWGCRSGSRRSFTRTARIWSASRAWSAPRPAACCCKRYARRFKRPRSCRNRPMCAAMTRWSSSPRLPFRGPGAFAAQLSQLRPRNIAAMKSDLGRWYVSRLAGGRIPRSCLKFAWPRAARKEALRYSEAYFVSPAGERKRHVLQTS